MSFAQKYLYSFALFLLLLLLRCLLWLDGCERELHLLFSTTKKESKEGD